MKLKVLSAVAVSLALAAVALADTTTVYNSKASTGSAPKKVACPMASTMKMDRAMTCNQSMMKQNCMTHCGM